MSGAYLGVDAGNSKTVALVCDDRGTVLGWGRAGIGDIYGAPDEQTAVRNVFTAVDAALDAAGVDAIRAAAFCLAGVDWPEDERFWWERVARRYPALGRFSVRRQDRACPARLSSRRTQRPAMLRSRWRWFCGGRLAETSITGLPPFGGRRVRYTSTESASSRPACGNFT